MKTIYDLAVETNETDLFNEIAEQLFFMDYPEISDSFRLSFDQAVSGYYYIRENGRSISANNPNMEAIVFCDFIKHRFYKEKKDSYRFWCKKDEPVFVVDIIYPHRVVMDYLIFRKASARKKVNICALGNVSFEYILSTDVKYIAVPDSVVKKYGEEKVLASFLIVAFKTFFMRTAVDETDDIEYFNNIPARLASFYYKKYDNLVANLDLKNMYYENHVYRKNFSDDALNEIIHHPMMRKVEREYGKL